MKNRIKQTLSHPLIGGSAVIFIGSNAASFFNFAYNLAMGRERFLTVAEYGVLTSLISIISIFGVFSSTILTIFAKFTARYVGEARKELVSALWKKGTLRVGVISAGICGLIVLLNFEIARFLHIKDTVLINLVAVILFFSFLSSVALGVLQGLLKIMTYSLISIFSTFVKFISGLILVMLGFKIFGAVMGMVISVVLGYIAIAFTLKDVVFSSVDTKLKLPNLSAELFRYGLPTLLSSLGMIMLISIDIILVKHFFAPEVAGQYAAIALIGRTIFYIVGPINFVLFPLVAQTHARGENVVSPLLLAILLTAVPSLSLSFIYFLFPGVVRYVFFPAKSYESIIPYVGPYSIFIIFYALSSLFTNFYLSIGKTNVFIFTISAALLEIVYITFVHNSMWDIIVGLIGMSFLLFVSLIFYYPYAAKHSLSKI